jgi:dynein heavy chain
MSDLTDISKKLDESQKILLSLLEQKRSEFPRFYFVSSDELFELLGNSKDPSKVNKHIRKCFEGVNKLKIDNQV